jgi:hypothetical protein
LKISFLRLVFNQTTLNLEQRRNEKSNLLLSGNNY